MEDCLIESGFEALECESLSIVSSVRLAAPDFLVSRVSPLWSVAFGASLCSGVAMPFSSVVCVLVDFIFLCEFSHSSQIKSVRC